MFILVSFCNIANQLRPKLAIVDMELTQLHPLSFSEPIMTGLGITGLAASQEFIYAVMQGGTPDQRVGRPMLLVLDTVNLSVVCHYYFRRAVDVHSLFLEDDILYAVSTGSDELVSLQVRGSTILSEEVQWRPRSALAHIDGQHFNSVCRWRGDLIVSAFGPRTPEALWKTVAQGLIINTSTDEPIAEGIVHPHSVTLISGSVAFCESMRSAFRILDPQHLSLLSVYTRGLCQIGDRVFVGTSIGRVVSRSTTTPVKTDVFNATSRRCTILHLSTDTFSLLKTLDLSSIASEIYDLLPLPHLEQWPKG